MHPNFRPPTEPRKYTLEEKAHLTTLHEQRTEERVDAEIERALLSRSAQETRGQKGRVGALRRFAQLPPKEQHDILRDTWKQVAMGVAVRAKNFLTTCPPHDFGKLYQLVQAGAQALDKAFPPKEQTSAPRLVVNLFGSLGDRAAKVAIPVVPHTIDAEAKEITDGEDGRGEGSSIGVGGEVPESNDQRNE